MTDAVLVDLDGTVADNEHRRHFVREGEKKNWKGFSDPILVDKDPLIVPISNVVKCLAMNHHIIYVSARHEELRTVSKLWLERNSLWIYPYRLYMRISGDYRPDFEIKKDLLGNIKHDGFNPTIVLDDRNSVVKMWRNEGLTCLQVAYGDF